ncbi:cadherin-like domain-containing protein [Stieleria varia]|uniref:Serine-aspartate repeat-containing protein D n=1 Tax=Stieleria varia TaxID=2528005 RepID=A0A5C6AN71_9BACT|nr:cadherin-like domain-containing protein [Stieleria varia]TWU00861.1 Serine-aspartate repeat-containing protein D precursor [Stieleria varia]
MKNLRHLLRRPRLLRASSRPTTKPQRVTQSRRLTTQALEKRELLAGDVGSYLAAHNYIDRYDVNQDFQITAADALAVVNRLAEDSKAGQLGALIGDGYSGVMGDVNSDNRITALDALNVIDALAAGEQIGEIVELQLRALTLNDQELDTDSSGAIEVGSEINLNEPFKLEISYNDLRRFSERLGVFQMFVDIGVSSGGNLQPFLKEAQELRFGDELANVTSGDFTIQLETGGPTATVTANDFVFGNPNTAIRNALVELGYTANQFTVNTEAFGTNGDGFRVIIQYTDDAFGNDDVPDLIVNQNFNTAVTYSFVELSPTDSSAAVQKALFINSIDFLSRTFNNNSPFYNTLPDGSFDSTTGFDEVGGLGRIPSGGGGIPELSNDGQLNLPFDAFSLPVILTQAIPAGQSLVADVNPGESLENLLVFGGGEVPADMILVDEDASVTFVSPGAVNNPPTVTGAVTKSFSENAGNQVVDLLEGASDPEGDALTVLNLVSNPASPAGITVNGTTVTVNPAAYASLNNGESEVITFTYQISDSVNQPISQTATVTITGVTQNTAPTVSGPATITRTEDDQPTFLNLLVNATDAEGDTLSVVGTPTVNVISGTADGITFDAANNRLNITPQAQGALNTGQQSIVSYTYQITDGSLTANTSATVTITGITDVVNNNPPVVTGPVTGAFTEDDANGTVNLLANASDPDGDTLSASTPVLRTGGDASGITFDAVNNRLNVTPSAYNSLAASESAQAIYDYSISDGNGGNVATSVTVTITGVNDAPTVTGVITRTLTENDAATTVPMLTGASDVDTSDVLNVTGVSITSDTMSGVSVTGTTINVNPAAYDSLNQGQQANIVVSYTIIDGNGGSVAQTANITIQGRDEVGTNNPPVTSGVITRTTNEDAGSFTVDLRENVSDPDGDTLNVVAPVNLTGNTAGAAVNGNILTITPSAYGSLNQGQQATVTATYTVTDGNGGNVSQTVTVTIDGRDEVSTNNPPVVAAPITRTLSEDDASVVLSLLTGASDPDGDTLSVANVTTTGDTSGVVVNGNNVNINPNAYNALFAGETSVITISYNVVDGNGGSVAQTATITITGANETGVPGSTISGDLYIDHIENLHEVIAGGTPFRNGVKDADESGLSGVVVTLFSAPTSNDSGAAINLTVLSDLDGHYEFTNLPPGTYTVSVESPESVMIVGSTSSQVVIGGSGGQNASGVSIGALGFQGSMQNLDILALPYLRANIPTSAISDGGREGGSVSLDASGNQTLFVAGEGYEGIRFAELTLNAAQDAALLTIVEMDGTVKTARLDETKFVLNQNGSAVRFFGGMEDFDFATDVDELIEQEFANYRNAVDQLLAGM